jgi:chromosome segregation ATPase
MYRRWFIGIGVALVGGLAFSQTAPAETDTLRSLLSEVRQLRQALQATTVNAQRAQIGLYRLQVQTLAVSRALQRSDEARAKLADAERWRKSLAGRVEDLEKNLQQKDDQNVEVELQRTKKELEWRTSEEQQLHTIETEATTQVQAEQAKLTELQDGLERLDKTLADQSQR